MSRYYILFVINLFTTTFLAWGEKYTISGKVVDERDKTPIAYATVFVPEEEVWTITNDDGTFQISLPAGKMKLTAQYLGYVTNSIEINVDKDIQNLVIPLKESNLTLNEVVVTAQKKSSEETTSYVIDRRTLDHAQIVNVSNLSTLLPGGKSIGDQNLASADNRIAIRSEKGEMGNATFGTAVEVDGVRLQNNSEVNEIQGVSLRNIATSNIESVEIITGIPSVEYGDLSSGIVKINTRVGKTPIYVDLAVEPKTKQIAINKGWELGRRAGTLNTSIERTKSITDILSPYTAYDRNALSLTYSNTLNRKSDSPISLTANITGNLGGFNSEADPDAFNETYTKSRDNSLRGNVKVNWLLNKSWITNISFTASASYTDKLEEIKSNKSSASTQPNIHTLENGYFVASKYDDNPNANIILSPIGYWYQVSYVDSKPIDYSLKFKADWVHRWGNVYNKLLFGVDFNTSGNLGRGNYYADMRYAPTWREYRYDNLPFLTNYAIYLEDRIKVPVGELSSLQITAGVRSDITSIKDSEYGTASAISPRVNAKYVFWERRDGAWSDFSIYAGVGKAVKLPSFDILYPSPSYADKLAFASTSSADNTSYYAYYTMPLKALYNSDLKWQHTRQAEFGAEAKISGTNISLSVFYNKTFNPYIAIKEYMPYSYKQTTQEHLNSCLIPVENREFTINQSSGVVTVHDRTGNYESQELAYNLRNTFQGRTRYTNGSPIDRFGVDWVVDFAQMKSLRTSVRFDGKYYYYRGLDETMCATMPSSASTMADGNPYKYVGYYRGSNGGTPSVSNGSLTHEVNTNLTITTHIPEVRMIFSVRIEGTILDYKQSLSQYRDGKRGFIVEDKGDFFGSDTDIYGKDKYVAVYPLYYSTWEEPDVRIPFAEKFAWAKDNDRTLYNELAKLVIKSNNKYYFNPNRISSYISANFNLTKEIGDAASITFFARNFFCHTGKVTSSQTGQESTLFNSTYIPKFYYGLSLRLKI